MYACIGDYHKPMAIWTDETTRSTGGDSHLFLCERNPSLTVLYSAWKYAKKDVLTYTLLSLKPCKKVGKQIELIPHILHVDISLLDKQFFEHNLDTSQNSLKCSFSLQ